MRRRFRIRDNEETWNDFATEHRNRVDSPGGEVLCFSGDAWLSLLALDSSSVSSSNLRMVWLQSLQKFLTFSFGTPRGNTRLWNTLFSYICAPLHYVYDRSSHKDFSGILHQSFPFAYTTSRARGSVGNTDYASVVLCRNTIELHIDFPTCENSYIEFLEVFLFFPCNNSRAQFYSFTVVLCKPWPEFNTSSKNYLRQHYITTAQCKFCSSLSLAVVINCH